MTRIFLLLALLSPGLALAQPNPDGVYRQARMESNATRDSFELTRGRFAGRHVVMGPRMPTASAAVFSTDNANSTFTLDVRGPGSQCESAVLRLGPDLVSSGGYGSGSGECSVAFTLDGEMATRAAAHFGVPRQTRSSVGDRVTGTFEGPGSTVRAGQAVEIRLKLFNPVGAPSVQRRFGGRQRGPRNNRFALRVTRDGQPVAEIAGMDFGGLGGMQTLAPGERATVTAIVDRWADVSVPGSYVVECTYSTFFSLDGVDVWSSDSRGRVWDRVFTGQVRFEVS